MTFQTFGTMKHLSTLEINHNLQYPYPKVSTSALGLKSSVMFRYVQQFFKHIKKGKALQRGPW